MQRSHLEMSTALQPFRQEAAYLFGLTSIQGNEFTILAKIEKPIPENPFIKGLTLQWNFSPGKLELEWNGETIFMGEENASFVPEPIDYDLARFRYKLSIPI